MLKKAKSMKTGRTADLPPAIYNNPTRMNSGGWVLIEEPKPAPIPVATTAPIEPMFDTLTTDNEDNATASTESKKSRKQKPQTNE